MKSSTSMSTTLEEGINNNLQDLEVQVVTIDNR